MALFFFSSILGLAAYLTRCLVHHTLDVESIPLLQELLQWSELSV
jgi:hypothetical protein